jgi:hypothetical protein
MFNRCTGRSHQIIAEDVNDGEMIYKLFMNQTVDHLIMFSYILWLCLDLLVTETGEIHRPAKSQ